MLEKINTTIFCNRHFNFAYESPVFVDAQLQYDKLCFYLSIHSVPACTAIGVSRTATTTSDDKFGCSNSLMMDFKFMLARPKYHVV